MRVPWDGEGGGKLTWCPSLLAYNPPPPTSLRVPLTLEAQLLAGVSRPPGAGWSWGGRK